MPTVPSLLACDFDSSDVCGFDYTAEYDWTRQSGSTPQWGTGPDGDHTSGSGYYMYAGSGDPGYLRDTSPFTLTSPLFGECVGSVHFYYHMHNSYSWYYFTSMLQLEATTDDGVTWDHVWAEWGDQGDGWQVAHVDVAMYVHRVRQRMHDETVRGQEGVCRRTCMRVCDACAGSCRTRMFSKVSTNSTLHAGFSQGGASATRRIGVFTYERV